MDETTALKASESRRNDLYLPTNFRRKIVGARPCARAGIDKGDEVTNG
jgi:hypothetical protein